MPYNPKMPDPSDVVKIKVIELPELVEVGEGLYDLRHGDNPKVVKYFDIISLPKELKKILPVTMQDRIEFIVDKLQNFRKVYLNLATGEISS